MTITVEAVFENGVLKPLSKAELQEHKKYTVSVEEAEDNWLAAPPPKLGNITFNEDPSLPLDESDWPDVNE